MIFEKIVEIDIVRCLKAIWKRKERVMIASLVGLVLGVLLAVFYVDTVDEYKATASVYSISYGSYDASAEGLQTLRAYEDVVKSLRVAERAALLLGDGSVDKFAIYDMIELEEDSDSQSANSSILNISAKTTNPDMAVAVANAVAHAFVLEINSVSPNESVQVLDEAYSADCVYNAIKKQVIFCALGLIGGLAIACVVIACVVIFSDKVSTVQDASLYGELEIIGAIPVISLEEPKKSKE